MRIKNPLACTLLQVCLTRVVATFMSMYVLVRELLATHEQRPSFCCPVMYMYSRGMEKFPFRLRCTAMQRCARFHATVENGD